MTWQPIETAPKDGTHILVYAYGEYSSAYYVAKEIDDEEYCGKGMYRKVKIDAGYLHYETDKYPTHWMPLPEPPKEVLK